MANNLFSFTGQSSPNQTEQAGINQYTQQGQNMIDPGQAAVSRSNPIQTAGVSNLAQALLGSQGQSQGPNAPIGNLPVAPGMYQSQGALENATGPLYPSQYAAQQAQPWLSRMGSALMSYL